jgi:LacI family transcriptional regulator
VFVEYSVDGVIITGSEKYTNENIQQLEQFGIPYVLIDREFSENSYSVFVDNIKGSYLATEYMIKCGHRNIAFIGGEGMIKTPQRRLNGYLEALKDYGIPVRDELIHVGTYHVETGYENTKKLIESGLDFSAITCGNDLIAFGALNAIKDKGLKIPEDISLVGYDDIYLASMMEPKLTTIRQPTHDISNYAMDILLKLMRKETVEDREKYFDPQLIERNSVKKILK